MKRLIFFLIFLIGLIVLGDFLCVEFILPNLSHFKLVDYVLMAGLVLCAIIVGMTFVIFLYRKKDHKISWLNKRLEQWSKLSVHVNRAGDEVFTELPIGIMIYDDYQEIKWVNKYAKKIFADDLLERKLADIPSSLGDSIAKSETLFVIQIENMFYEVIHRIENHIIYLFDVTNRENIRQKYIDRTPVLGIITIDNLEMELKNFDLQESAKLRGQYLGEISNWTEQYNAYLKSYDDDSLVFVLDNASFHRMMDDKFTILDKVREISSNNGVRITLSIGIADWDVNYEELGTYAQNAIDLAEKRGGDQVVVNIQGEKIQYFGAKTNALEKNNLLEARANTLALKDAIEASTNIYIMGHMMADADALGAMIGGLKMALSSKKPAKIAIDYQKIDITSQRIFADIIDQDPTLYNYFVSPEEVNDITPDSLLLIVDTQSPRLIMDPEFMRKFKRIAVIDHHRTDDAGFINPVFSYLEPYASSTVELVSEMFQFYQKEGVPITSFEATVMLAGIVVDTNNFTFRCGARTFEAAANLREYGADMIDIRRILRNDQELQMSLAKNAQNMETILEHYGICVIDANDPITDKTMLAKMSEYLLNIDNIEATFTIAPYTDGKKSYIAISARSYKTINVQIIMEEMGGGGHLNSAATQISGKTIEEVKEELITIIKRDHEVGGESMKIILLEDVKGRGVKDDIIDVAVGYGNYLITNQKGILASEENVNKLHERQRQAQIEEENQKKLMQKIKEEIEEKCVNIYIKIGNDGKLFGHVTTKQICEEFEAQSGIHLDKRKVTLPFEINALGVYTANVNLHKDIVASLEINVLEK